MRKATKGDIRGLIALDAFAYGSDGASKEYFLEKFSNTNATILIVEEKGLLSGFAVIETYNNGKVPVGFSSMKTKNLPSKWIFIAAFTTKTNYKDKEEDKKPIEEIEKHAKKMKCKACFVPLSKDHPYEKHDVFLFWKKQGYQKCGEISWISNSKQIIECYLLKKELD